MKRRWRVRIEKNDVSGRVYTPARRRRIKLCRPFPGENTRRELRLRPFNASNSQRGDSGCSSPEKCSCKKRSLRLREKAPLYPPAYSERPWILMDPFSPAELSAGTTLICIMQFTCAIYARARPHSFEIYLVVVVLERINVSLRLCFPFFPSLIYFLLSPRNSRFLSMRWYLCTYKRDCTRRKHELPQIKITNIWFNVLFELK